MTPDVIERFRFYLTGKIRQDRMSANNSRLNGYLAIASEKENEAVYGEQLLKELVDA
jgi:hypothetical protein